MKGKIFSSLKIIVPVGLGVFLVAHIYGQLDDSQREVLFSSIRQANYGWVLLSVGMGILSHLIRGYRWRYQFEAMGVHTRPLNNFLAVMIGYIVNMALPRVGEVSRAAAISRTENIPFQNSFGTILSERAVDLIVLVLITATTIALQQEALAPYGTELKGVVKDIIASNKIWILAGALAAGALFAFFIYRKYRAKPFVQSIRNLVKGLYDGVVSIFKMPNSGKYLMYTIAIWALYVGMFWVCFWSLPETSNLSINAVMAGFIVGSFAIVLIPGGIGAFPVGIMECLALYGIPTENGFALGWILWLSQTVMILVVGAWSMIYMPIYNKNYVRNTAVANPV